MLNITTQI